MLYRQSNAWFPVIQLTYALQTESNAWFPVIQLTYALQTESNAWFPVIQFTYALQTESNAWFPVIQFTYALQTESNACDTDNFSFIVWVKRWFLVTLSSCQHADTVKLEFKDNVEANANGNL